MMTSLPDLEKNEDSTRVADQTIYLEDALMILFSRDFANSFELS